MDKTEEVKDNKPEPKPNESRLLGLDEIRASHDYWNVLTDNAAKRIAPITQAQDAKTARIKDQECQQRVERIFKEIEDYEDGHININPPGYFWQELKKKEGVE